MAVPSLSSPPPAPPAAASPAPETKPAPPAAPVPDVPGDHWAAKAVQERRKLDLAEARDLQQAMDQAWANLPGNYQWLKDWEYV